MPDGLEGGGNTGQLAIDMSPTQPHTMTKNARTCESCHVSDKAIGLGIDGTRPWDQSHFVDLERTDGTILSKRAQPQVEAIENLNHDWSQIVDRDGRQLSTVGHHWKLSRAFDKDELARMSRNGTCVACHQEIPENSNAINLLHHLAEYSGQLPKTAEQHASLIHKIVLLSAWVQVLTPLVAIAIGCVAFRIWRRRQIGRMAVTE